jgi:hypothetical protein
MDYPGYKDLRGNLLERDAVNASKLNEILIGTIGAWVANEIDSGTELTCEELATYAAKAFKAGLTAFNDDIPQEPKNADELGGLFKDMDSILEQFMNRKHAGNGTK